MSDSLGKKMYMLAYEQTDTARHRSPTVKLLLSPKLTSAPELEAVVTKIAPIALEATPATDLALNLSFPSSTQMIRQTTGTAG